MPVADLPDWIGQLLFGFRHWTSNGSAVNDSDTTNAIPPLVAAWNPATGKVDLSLSGSPALGNATVTSITYSPGYDVIGPAPARLTTTDANPHTLVTVSVAPGAVVIVDFFVVANLGTSNGTGNVNAPNAVGVWSTTAALFRVGSGSVQIALIAALSSAAVPFCHVASASSAGLVAIVAGATSAAIQVNGFAVTEAWTTGHTYTRGDGSTTPGQFVTNAGNVYVCTTSGIAGASAPTGTGTGISDGACVWAYVCAGSTVPVQWTMGAPRVLTG